LTEEGKYTRTHTDVHTDALSHTYTLRIYTRIYNTCMLNEMSRTSPLVTWRERPLPEAPSLTRLLVRTAYDAASLALCASGAGTGRSNTWPGLTGQINTVHRTGNTKWPPESCSFSFLWKREGEREREKKNERDFSYLRPELFSWILFRSFS